MMCCQNISNENTTTEKVNIEKKYNFESFIKNHKTLFDAPCLSEIILTENQIYTGYYYDMQNGIYTISISLHPKPFFVANEFFVDTLKGKPIVFSNLEKLILNDKKKYDSIINLPENLQLIKDSIISINQDDARFIDKNDIRFYFKKENKKSYIILDRNQLQDSIKKYNKSNIDYYEYVVLPNQFK